MMISMKPLCVHLVLLLAIAAILVPVVAAAEESPHPSANRSGEVEVPVVRTTTIAPTHTLNTAQTTPSKTEEQTTTVITTLTHTPTKTLSPTPTHTPTPTQTPTKTISPTLTHTPTVFPTQQLTTQPTTVPVVTVTVFVYPYGPVYYPDYYYPTGYPYPYGSYYPSGSLTVISSPSDAIVIIDGYTTKNTPYVFTNLMPGYHTVEIDYPGYEAYVTSIYIDSGASQELDASLIPLVMRGSLFVDSRPEGADVYVDGNYQGTSAVTVSGLAAGIHQIEFHLAGYEVLTQMVDVLSGQGTNINAVLIPYASSSTSGSIDISSDLPGALVYLDGIYKGSTQSGTIFNIIAASPEPHSLLLHEPGYSDFTQTVVVYSGQIAHVHATFVQSTTDQQALASVSQQPGSIHATSIPSGGEVYLDNQFRGVAPVTIYNVAPGNHIVNMKLAGSSDWSTSVQVDAGQVVAVPATFTPSGSPVPTRAGLPAAVLVAALLIAGVVVALLAKK
jgi:hypothetical protein